MNNENVVNLTKEQCKQLVEKMDLDKLFDRLLVEYQKRTNSKQLKVELVRKDK